MKEHFHHCQRIADFMRDFSGEQAERGKFFVPAQFLLHVENAFVEPRPLDGRAGQFRKRGENSDFLV